MGSWITPVKTWVHGEEPPASTWNAELKDRFEYLFANQSALGGFFSGLLMGTHEDSDKAGTQVQLRSLRRVILDDGRGLSNLGPLVANIASGGAGGLDTGSPVNSTWYEIYLIYNGTTPNLLLHRAKAYAADASYDSPDATVPIRQATNTRTALGQGFQLSAGGKIEFCDVTLIRVGAVTGNIWAELREDDGTGKPNAVVLAKSTMLDASGISTSAQKIRIPFRTIYTGSASTQYHLVMTGDWTASDAVYIGWRCDTSAATYANGTRTQLEGGTWNNTGSTAHDFSFTIALTTNEAAVTMPSGYTGKCLLGYVFRGAGGTFVGFQGLERTYIPLTTVNTGAIGVTSAINTLRAMPACVPPIPVIVRLYATKTAGTTMQTYVLPVPFGFPNPGGVWRQNGAQFLFGGTVMEVQTDFQSFYDRDDDGHSIVLDSFDW